ncbi:MAG: hypothetical protein ACRER5_04145 [Pseudomonas sp.]
MVHKDHHRRLRLVGSQRPAARLPSWLRNALAAIATLLITAAVTVVLVLIAEARHTANDIDDTACEYRSTEHC